MRGRGRAFVPFMVPRRTGGSAIQARIWATFNVGATKPLGIVDVSDSTTRNVGPRFDEYPTSVSGTTVQQPTGLLLLDDTRIRFTYSGFSDFDPSVSYWVVNATGGTFQVSLIQGGAAVNGGTADVAVAQTDLAPTVVSGDQDMTGADPTLDFVDIFGKVTVKNTVSGTPTIVDSIVRGTWTLSISSSSAVDAAVWGDSSNMRGLEMTWSRIDLSGRETPFTDGFRGGDGLIDYSEIYRAVDGLSFNDPSGGGGSSAKRTRIAYGAYYSWHDDSNPGNNCAVLSSLTARGITVWPGLSSKDTHGDGCQIFQGGPWYIGGCNFGGPRSASAPGPGLLDPYVPADAAIIDALDAAMDYENTGGVIVNSADPNNFPISGTVLEYNWIDGGPAGFNIVPTGVDTMSGVTCRYNVIHSTTPANYPITHNSSSATITGNVDENGDPVTVY